MNNSDTFELASVTLFQALVALHFDCTSKLKHTERPSAQNTGPSIAHAPELELEINPE